MTSLFVLLKKTNKVSMIDMLIVFLSYYSLKFAIFAFETFIVKKRRTTCLTFT